MKVKTANLKGAALDWAVNEAQSYNTSPLIVYDGCEGEDRNKPRKYLATEGGFTIDYSNWAQGGPILTRERISRTIDHSGLWIAYWTDGYTDGDEGKKWMQCDRSELIAGLRCYVASELGDEVDVPDELI